MRKKFLLRFLVGGMFILFYWERKRDLYRVLIELKNIPDSNWENMELGCKFDLRVAYIFK